MSKKLCSLSDVHEKSLCKILYGTKITKQFFVNILIYFDLMNKGLSHANYTYLNIKSLKFTKYLFQEALSSFKITQLPDKIYCK